MNELELKTAICQAAANLTVATMDTRSVNKGRLMDGNLSDEEKLENLEVWSVFQVYCQGIAASLQPANATTLGFENLTAVLNPETPTQPIPNPGPTDN